MKALWPFALVSLVSLCGGAALDEVARMSRDRNDAAAFERRVSCRNLADAYEKKEASTTHSVSVDKVDFSRSKLSCVATIIRRSGNEQGAVWFFQTLDLVTGDALYSEWCSEKNPDPRYSCGNGRNVDLKRKRDNALEAVLSKE